MKKFVVLTLAWTVLAVGLLSAAPPRREDAPKLIEALKSSDAKARLAAARGLGELGQLFAPPVRPAIPTLLEMVKKDPDEKVREACAVALGRTASEGEKVIPVLIEVIKNDKEDRTVRMAAILALNGFSDQAKDAIPVLRRVAKEEREKDQQLATTAGRTAKFLISGQQ